MDRVVNATPVVARMRVAFRVDASIDIGTGHVMRCLTLANALREHGAQCEFVCRAHPGHLAGRIESAGHAVHLLPLRAGEEAGEESAVAAHAHWLGSGWRRDAAETVAALGASPRDWLVVDHYALEAGWESEAGRVAARSMAIDDLADRMHRVDLLLDQNLGRAASDYDSLLPASARCLAGPDYALLRPDFARLRDYSLARREAAALRRVLVSLGGVDRDNLTGRVLDALATVELPRDARVTVVMGKLAPGLDPVRAQASRMPFACDVRVDIDDMAQVMADADLAIGAAGSSSWERCVLGLPTIMLVLAENQRGIAAELEKAGACMVVASDGRLPRELADAMRRLDEAAERTKISRAAAAVLDGCGIARVAAAMGACR